MSARAVAWAVLLAAALLEVVWALALKQPHPGWVALGIAVALVSLGMLSFALRELPVGGAYAVWVGLGTVGVAVVGILVFAEPAGPLRMFFLALILAGVIGLNLPARPTKPVRRADAESTSRAGG
jgi:quaternary ammonium compound-resistance protein SugE